MSETMVERVARRIANIQACSEDDWRHFVQEARAAIAELREPTVAMIENGVCAALGESPSDEAADVWRSMIDAALTEHP